MSLSMRLQGAKELDKVLQSLKTSTARGITRRAMTRALEPVAQAARALAPRDEGKLAAHIGVSTRLTKRQAREIRGQASRDTQIMYVGPEWASAHLVELGTGPRHKKNGQFVGRMPPQPFMRPAWDAKREEVLARLTDDIRAEIDKTLARLAKRQAKGLG
jgi:HK97 gp10 family phage protein